MKYRLVAECNKYEIITIEGEEVTQTNQFHYLDRLYIIMEKKRKTKQIELKQVMKRINSIM